MARATEYVEGVGRRARWPSAAGMVKSTLLMSKRYCNAVGKEAIKPTTPTHFGRSGVGLLATAAFRAARPEMWAVGGVAVGGGGWTSASCERRGR